MSNELENQIDEDLLKDKFINFYNKNKYKIIFSVILLIIIPISLQVYLFIDKKTSERQISDLLKAEVMMKKNPEEALKILNFLQLNGKEVVKILANGRLLEFYINSNNYLKAQEEINKFQYNFGDSMLKELNSIKKTILNFEKIDENEILNTLEIRKYNLNNSYFKLIKKKLLYDYYIKKKEYKKAEEVLSIPK